MNGNAAFIAQLYAFFPSGIPVIIAQWLYRGHQTSHTNTKMFTFIAEAIHMFLFFFSSHIYITQVTLNEPFTSCKPFPTQTFLSKHPKLFWEWQYWQKNSCRSSMDTTHLQDAVSVESPKIPTIASRNQRHIITSQKRKLPTKAAANLASNGLKCK